jgi:hypothetical protein
MAKRAGHNFTQLCVPTMIEELDVSRSALEMSAQAWMSADVFWYRLSMGPIADELLGILPIFQPEVLLPRELSIYPEPLLFHLISRVPSPTSHIQSPLSYISYPEPPLLHLISRVPSPTSQDVLSPSNSAGPT